MIRVLILIITSLLSAIGMADSKNTIKIAAIDWCPQLCPNQDQKGYIIDIVKEIYRDSGYQLEIETYPWSRALTMVRQGRVDAVLSPARAEAPALRYPQQEVGFQRMCFLMI
ncbi:transporter substrate-binding domain-containing protein [Neptuniibacter caesariensis]|nr:transporter substrate-binding domain-containing protein [Neptuniibacter caesariensis]